MGAHRDPDYWRKWRAAHPAYQARERARSARRRARGDRGDRTTEYRNRAAKRAQAARMASADNGWAETGHPIMDAAALACRAEGLHPDRRTYYVDPLYEDALMTAALAILRGEDPFAAVRGVVRAERHWRYRTAPLYEFVL